MVVFSHCHVSFVHGTCLGQHMQYAAASVLELFPVGRHLELSVLLPSLHTGLAKCRKKRLADASFTSQDQFWPAHSRVSPEVSSLLLALLQAKPEAQPLLAQGFLFSFAVPARVSGIHFRMMTSQTHAS